MVVCGVCGGVAMTRPRLLDLFCCGNVAQNSSIWYNDVGKEIPMSFTIKCEYCGKEVEAQRKTKRFCSTACEQRQRRDFPKERACRHCGKMFPVITRADANRQHCSKECAKNHNRKLIKAWNEEHPEAMKKYNANRVKKNPSTYQVGKRQERLEMIRLLGGKCIVCGVDNPYWLHIDYIPTTRNERYRHPRHLRYVREHLDKFRLLCANHHYELTLTGHIEGTDIWQ